jgi:hypothetical protein
MDAAINLDLLSFRRRLGAASSPQEVLRVVRGILFSIPPECLEGLPEACRELSVYDASSLCRWSAVFSRAVSTVDAPHESFLHRLSVVLSDGAQRLVYVASSADSVQESR